MITHCITSSSTIAVPVVAFKPGDEASASSIMIVCVW